MRAQAIVWGVALLFVFVHGLPVDKGTADPARLGRVELEKDVEEFPVDQFPLSDSFFGGFNDLFERMRQHMLYLMSHVPRVGFATPEGGNTTSVTKIIDGHKVVINETVYTDGNGDDTAAIFKVRVVDIRPESSEEDADVPAGAKGSVESVEQSHENEIPKGTKNIKQQKRRIHKEDLKEDVYRNRFNDLESFDYPNEFGGFDDTDNGLETMGGRKEFSNEIETFDEEAKVPIPSYPSHWTDLSNDILVNKIAEERGQPKNPDSEFIDINPRRFKPFDLSRDTYINEIAARNGRRPNPDAEVFHGPSPNTAIHGRRAYPNAEVFHHPIPNSALNRRRVYPGAEVFHRRIPISENLLNADLSRDTYVNEIAHRNRMPLNPDAEYIDNHPKGFYYYKTENS